MKNKILRSVMTISTLSILLLAGCQSNSTSSEKDTSSSKETTTSSSKEKVDLNSLDLPQLSTEVAADESLVEIETSMGNIKIKLFPKLAPKAVENFVTHAKEGYYNDTTFHRVINEFMIQGGDPEGTGSGGESIWKKEFAPEISNQLYHIRGALAVARTSGDVTAKTQGSQFYIVQNDEDQSDGLLYEDYPEKIIEAYKNGGTPTLDKNYSVFGQVIEGMDVVDKIAATEIDANDKPTEEVKVITVKVLQEAK